MGTHMKTTIDIADPLLEAAKAAAQQRGITLRALVEAGLRKMIEEPGKNKRPFKLRKASFRGRGLQDGAQGASWEQLRETSYGDRAR